MKYLNILLLKIILTIIPLSLTAQHTNKDYWDGILYVKMNDNVSALIQDCQVENTGYECLSKIPGFENLAASYKLIAIKKPFRTDALKNIVKLYFDDIARIEDFALELGKLPYVEYAVKAPIYKTFVVPNDVHANQWYMNLIEAYDAWDITTGNASVKVAIVDDAVKISHPDLASIIWNNPLELPDSIDNDGNGFVDDVHGWDVANDDNDPEPPTSHWMYQFSDMIFTHGTHCAGIAGAATNNSQGIASIGYGISIIPVKCTADNSIIPLAIDAGAEGIDYAIAAGANVISLSWGSGQIDPVVRDAINAALAEDIIVVAAAGNDGSETLFYPASQDGVISVGAITKNDIIASFSQRNEKVTLMAPGDSIWSCQRKNNGYMYLQGTSMACPMVAGLAGLLKSYDTTLTAATIKTCLIAGCDNIDAVNPAQAGLMGAGRINARRSLECIQNGQNIIENNYKSSLLIFPNPAYSTVNMLFYNEENYTELQLINIMGKIHRTIKLNKKDVKLEIDVQNLAQGIYFIMLSNNNKRNLGGKFLKAN